MSSASSLPFHEGPASSGHALAPILLPRPGHANPHHLGLRDVPVRDTASSRRTQKWQVGPPGRPFTYRLAVRVAVLADTHLRTSDLRRLPTEAVRAVAQADLLVHAGDVVSVGALHALCDLGPVHAVLGNNDRELTGALPESLVLDLAGVSVAVLHDSGRREGRAARLQRRFPSADVVVFGHSHVPVDEVGLGGQALFNPGSPTQRRAQPRCSFGLLDLEDGQVVRRQIVPL
jgi:uncharacterized protein